jgi:hypothetical protein
MKTNKANKKIKKYQEGGSVKNTPPKELPKPEDVTYNEAILHAAETVEGGGYNWKGGTTGSPFSAKKGGKDVMSKQEDGSYCSGYTCGAALTAMERIGALEGLDDKKVKDFKSTWYGSKGYKKDDKSTWDLSGNALEEHGLGYKVDREQAKPGDIAQIWRENGSGHSVIFKDWVVDDNGEKVGIKYRSTQPSTNGVGDRVEYFNTKSGKQSINPENVFVSRVGDRGRDAKIEKKRKQEERQNELLQGLIPQAMAGTKKMKMGGKVEKYPFGGDVGDLLGNIFGGNFDPSSLTSLIQRGSPSSTVSMQMTDAARPKMDFEGKERNFLGFKTRDFKRAQKDFQERDESFFKSLNQGKEQAEQLSALLPLFDQFRQFSEESTQQRFNPQNYSTQGISSFQEGGEVQDGQEGGPVPIQAEKGELAVLPDLKIVNVNAKKKHKNMPDNKVTDILPAGSFVASANDKMAVSKKEAENISFGYEAGQYEEGKSGSIPKELTLADIMKKDKMTPAEILKKVESMYKVSNRENDPFTELADAENLGSRAPYVEALKFLYETKKPKKQASPENMMLGGFVSNTGSGRNPLINDKKKYFIPNMAKQEAMPEKAIKGALISPVLQGIMGVAQGIGQNMRAKSYFGQQQGVLDEAVGRQESFLGAGSALGALGVLGQDSRVEAPQFDTRYLDAMPQEVPQSASDFAARQIQLGQAGTRRSLIENAGNFGQAAANLGLQGAQATDSMSNLAFQNAMQNIGMRSQYLGQRSAMAERQAAADVQARNQTRANINQQVGALADVGTNYFTNRGVIDASRARSQMALNQGRFDAREKAMSNIFGGVRQGINTGGQIYDGFMADNQATGADPGVMNRLDKIGSWLKTIG